MINRPLLLLSTCGTSTLTNEASGEVRKWLTSIANASTLSDSDALKLREHTAERLARLLKANQVERRLASAELNGIGAVLDCRESPRVQHLLVHTDTIVGQAAAELVQKTLAQDGSSVEMLTAPGLRTDDAASFREALADLTWQLEEQVPSYRRQGWEVIFNLTGGFKSINAYIQALGMLHADRCVFLFEGVASLMAIPRLPIRLAEAEDVREHLSIFRRIAFGYHVATSEANSVPDTLLFEDDGQVTTSVWGAAVWARVRKTLLGEALLKPLSTKLTLSDTARKAFDQLESERKVQVNEALDALSSHLDHGRPLLHKNAFKKLVGKPKLPSTHEFYLWSDGAAWRLYGHFEEETFVANTMGPHL